MARLIPKELLNRNNITSKQLDFIESICYELGLNYSEVIKTIKNKKEASNWIRNHIDDFNRERYQPLDVYHCIDDSWEWDCPKDIFNP